MVFDKMESAIIPAGDPVIEKIRKLLQEAANRLTMQKEKNTYKLEAWVEPMENEAAPSGDKR